MPPRTKTLHTASDLGLVVRDFLGVGRETVSDDLARDTMHAIGLARYEEIDATALDTIITRLVSEIE